eukprot:SAG31_NODE_3775_length_3896_cov_2.532666_3_plen_577_part_01
MFGALYTFLAHVDSSQLLAVTGIQGNKPVPTVLTLEQETTPHEHIFDCWCIERVGFQWCGTPVRLSSLESQAITMKHAGSGRYLGCETDGELCVAEEYFLEKFHWKIVPFDFEVEDPSAPLMAGKAFYLVSKASGRVLVFTEDNRVETVQLGAHKEHDCFIAKEAPEHGSHNLSLAKGVIAQYEAFSQVIRDFNRKHGQEMDAAADDVIRMHADMARWNELHSIPTIAAFESMILRSVGPIVSSLGDFFLQIFPQHPHFETTRQLLEHDGVVNELLAQVAGDAGIVETIFNCFELYLFKTPRELFGAPSCFFGTDIFLTIRASFRLCAIVCSRSEKSASQFLSRLDWVTDQIGVGQFKVADALSAILDAWPSLVDTIPVRFANKIWNLVKTSTDQGRGNGDHCQLLSVFCMPRGRSVARNQNALKNAVADDFLNMISEYLSKDVLFTIPSDNGLLPPTDERYFFAKLIELLTAICHNNIENCEYVSQLLSHEQITDYVFSDHLHPLVRAAFARLGIVVVVDTSQTGYPLPKSVRVDPYIKMEVMSQEQNAAKRVPAISKMKHKCVSLFSLLKCCHSR